MIEILLASVTVSTTVYKKHNMENSKDFLLFVFRTTLRLLASSKYTCKTMLVSYYEVKVGKLAEKNQT